MSQLDISPLNGESSNILSISSRLRVFHLLMSLLNGDLKIGKNVLLAKECFIDYTGNVTIEDYVQIAFGAIIQTHYHPWHSDYRNEHSTEQTSIIIREGAVIGSKAIVMASCHYIGKHARVGAGAVVTHNVPDYAVVVGSPAKVVRIQEH